MRLLFRRCLSIQAITRNADTSAPLIEHLTGRGLVSNTTSNDLEQVLAKRKVTLYLGADPTAKSLHVGNMVPLMVLLHFYIRGHNPIALVGGATGVVGDPSGRTTERSQMVDQERDQNVRQIHAQMERFLHRGFEYAQKRGFEARGEMQTANNADWWRDMNMLHFLGTYGRHIRVGHMLARESVKARLDSEQGIGFNEFTYQILQAYDFWHLFKTRRCTVQIGGNDQWGNITAGIDLISRIRSSLKGVQSKWDAFGVTVPLLTTPSGEKFGKSAGNAVWLDAELTRPYELYQYFIKSPDSVVDKYLRLFTLLPCDTIDEVIAKHTHDESARYAQRVLAQEVTDLVHGEGAGERAELVSSVLFGDGANTTRPAEIVDAFEQEDLVKELPRGDIVGDTWRNALAKVLGKSKSECGRLLKSGGVYAGLDRHPVRHDCVQEHDLNEDLLLVRTGKSSYTVVKLV